jgi:hypothetical protein
MSENGIWETTRTAQLTKFLEASTNSSERGVPEEEVHEPFPALVPNASRSENQISISKTAAWSEDKTAQVIKDLKTKPAPSKSAPHRQKPVEAFPSLGEPAIVNEKAAEATQFWNGLTKRITNLADDRVVDNSEIMEKSRANKTRIKKDGGRNKGQWVPLQLN